jgi:preprotein translocase subunit SecA
MERLNPDNFRELLLEKVHETFNAKLQSFGDEVMDHLIKVIMLQTIDSQWKDHLLSIDHLKEGIGLRGYGQKDPKQEYKKEAYALFMDMIGRIREELMEKIFWVQLAQEGDVERIEQTQKRQRLVFNLVDEETVNKPAKVTKIGRNDPCPCGSGKKYKKCCGT